MLEDFVLEMPKECKECRRKYRTKRTLTPDEALAVHAMVSVRDLARPDGLEKGLDSAGTKGGS